MLKEPIKLSLYDKNNVQIKEYECTIIPWGMLKQALSFQKYLSEDDVDDELFDAMGTFVCDLFRKQFTLEDLNAGADLIEVMSVIKTVVGYAGAINPNVLAGQ